MSRARRRTALLAAWVLGACAAPAVLEVAPPAAQVEPRPGATPLELALGTVRAERIAADVAFLADDLLAGRDSPSDGLRISANYLLARLAGLGFQPGAKSGFRHVFELDSKRIDGERTRARWSDGAADLVYAHDFGVHPTDGVSARTRGEVVFAGRGRADDLAACELRGRWALCVGQRLGRRRSLQRDLRAAGALGLICVAEPDDDLAPGAPPAEFESWKQLSQRMRPGPLRERDEAPCAAVWLSSAARARIEGLAVGDVLGAEFELEIAGGGSVPVENLAALWPGSHPERRRELIVLTAHYDHVGVGRSGAVMNGADDNASGSAALLAVAEALARRGALERGVLLLWVGAEELGLLGSAAWCREPDLPEGLAPVANLNLDMVGRNAPDYLELTPSPEHPAWGPLAALAVELAGAEGFSQPRFMDQDFERSDQASFHQILGLPVVFLSTGEHEDYHGPGDDADKIDADKIARVARLSLRILELAQSIDLAPLVLLPARVTVGDEPDVEPGFER